MLVEVETRPAPADSLPRRSLLPRWTALTYLVSPPFLAALLNPQILKLDGSAVTTGLLPVWVHTLCVGATLHGAFTWVVPRVAPEGSGRARQLAVYSGTIVACVVAALAISRLLVRDLCPAHAQRNEIHELYVALLISAGFVAVLTTYKRLRHHVREVEQREARALQAALQAELRSLQSRTNPHFLFNALNTVAGLIAENPRRAEDAIERIADIFRYSLNASRRQMVPLGEEIDAVRAYLEMEALRFEDRFAWRIDVDDDAAAMPVPPLAVQPLVENAVRHGVEGRGGGTVRIMSHRDGDTLRISVHDDGPGPGGSVHRGTRTSLGELGERLRLLYGGRAAMNFSRGDGGGYVVRLALPAE